MLEESCLCYTNHTNTTCGKYYIITVRSRNSTRGSVFCNINLTKHALCVKNFKKQGLFMLNSFCKLTHITTFAALRNRSKLQCYDKDFNNAFFWRGVSVCFYTTRNLPPCTQLSHHDNCVNDTSFCHGVPDSPHTTRYILSGMDAWQVLQR